MSSPNPNPIKRTPIVDITPNNPYTGAAAPADAPRRAFRGDPDGVDPEPRVIGYAKRHDPVITEVGVKYVWPNGETVSASFLFNGWTDPPPDSWTDTVREGAAPVARIAFPTGTTPSPNLWCPVPAVRVTGEALRRWRQVRGEVAPDPPTPAATRSRRPSRRSVKR